jgi:pimeloyl-ACP methyl ester carboxylesterase
VTDVTYVLIPGAGGSAWYWHLVDAELRQRGHDVVVVDLPADDDAAGLPEYTDTVIRGSAGRPWGPPPGLLSAPSVPSCAESALP